MGDEGAGLVEARREHRRVVGSYGGTQAGPTLIVLGGIHGNEPSGVIASERVLEHLQNTRSPLRGTFVALTGNLQALERGVRFIARDLNRAWAEAQVAAALEAPEPHVAEVREQRDLHAALLEAVLASRGDVRFLDLHTSSADGPPFLTIGDTLRNRSFAMGLKLPVILGLEEQVDGALLEYMNNRGHVTMGVEAGRHDRDSSVDHHEAVLWLALEAAGMLETEHVPDRDRVDAVLERASRGIPRIVEVRHRHAVRPQDGFRMRPGFTNFTPVERGQVLADDARGPIRAPESGLVLLPLYQGQGDDGFFIAREIRPFWLRLSARLRGARMQSLIRMLPGVSPHPEIENSLVVDTRIARLYPLEVFHLFGFRKLRRDGTRLIVSRRRYDLEGPTRS